jgi:hypothetical protein
MHVTGAANVYACGVFTPFHSYAGQEQSPTAIGFQWQVSVAWIIPSKRPSISEDVERYQRRRIYGTYSGFNIESVD